MTALAALHDADRAVAAAAEPARKSPPLAVLGPLSDIADQPPLFTLCAATLVAGLVARDPRLIRAGGTTLAAALVATALKGAVKHRIDRTRPKAVAKGADYALERGSSPASDDNSFPSGHTAGAVAVVRALGREYPRARGVAYAAAGAAALVQIPRGKHYPADLAAGAVIGLVADAVVAAAVALTVAGLRRYRVGTGSAPE